MTAAPGNDKGPQPRRPIPPFSEEHEDLRESVRSFIEKEVRPHTPDWERAREFPRELFARMGELGFLGLKYPAEHGGQGGDHIHDAIFLEELARSGSAGVAAGIGAHVGIATPPIFEFGTVDQKRRWLEPAIAGKKICALAITEPEAGSDVAGIKTHARRVDGGYVVNGSKTFITNGVRGDVFVTAVKTTEGGGHQGLSFLVLEKGMPGFSVARKLEKMGWHASDTAELALEDVEVPEENLLGEENHGFYMIMANFQWERLLMALSAVGGMQLTFEVALNYALEREAFGRKIGHFQTLRHKLAQMATLIEGARDFTYHCLRLFINGQECTKEVSMAKVFCTETAVKIADDAVQIHGGYGYMAEYQVERGLRDARLGPIGGGTSEIMKEIIGKQLGL